MVSTLVSICFTSPRLGHTIKTNCMKLQTVDPDFDFDFLNFDFLKKGLGLVSPIYFVYDFSRKIFLMLYSVN